MNPATKMVPPERFIDVGEKLKELRKSRRLTQMDLAARIGVQQSDLCRMEKGQYRVSLETLFKILGELQITFAEFFQEKASPVMTRGEADLLDAYRHLPAESQEGLLTFIRDLVNPDKRSFHKDH